MSNKGYNKEEKSFEAQAVVMEEAPIEASPIAEEVKEDFKVIPEVRQEVKPAPQVKIQPKAQGKIIAIMRDGCLVENLAKKGDVRQLFGKSYLAKKIGDIIEF